MQVNDREVRAGQGWLARIVRMMSNAAPRRSLILLAVLVAATACAANAQTLIGTPGAGWQTWSVTPISSDQPNLNDNGSPWWDLQWRATSGSYGGTGADKNPGFCITSTGDCVGMGSQAFAPGALPFWGMHYDNVGDTEGIRDDKVYFHSNGASLVATLYLNATANPSEVNDFGWFETNSTGTLSGKKHKLFSGTGINYDQIPTATGTTVIFKPTAYFGYYYSDVSEPACPDGTDTTYPDGVHPCADPTAVTHGCYANSIFLLNDQRCTEVGGGQGDHDFVVFSKGGANPTFWVAGEDPSDCKSNDGDCNLTLVRVAALPKL
ncbi:MAG TPA: hypothetical protein VK747_11585 [Blastocatellia bacterium]|nr:hypothetical protein [Blastocatellia bacterium]